jgi:GNAT superfamily N-acetyltransferase
MNDSGWRRRNLETLQTFDRLAVGSVETARLIEHEGLVAMVSPAVPERSVFNSVVYTEPEALVRHREELAAIYASEGCAWTVWVPEEDRESAALLESAGHRLDAEPRAMGMDLAEVESPDLSAVDWSVGRQAELMCTINDRAYGYPDGTWRRGVGTELAESLVYLANDDGEAISTVLTFDSGEDCGVFCVATLPEARGKGLATALMRQALVDARERGQRTTTLQATRAGAPIYERIGYRDFGALQMWEWRE